MTGEDSKRVLGMLVSALGPKWKVSKMDARRGPVYALACDENAGAFAFGAGAEGLLDTCAKRIGEGRIYDIFFGKFPIPERLFGVSSPEELGIRLAAFTPPPDGVE